MKELELQILLFYILVIKLNHGGLVPNMRVLTMGRNQQPRRSVAFSKHLQIILYLDANLDPEHKGTLLLVPQHIRLLGPLGYIIVDRVK